MSRVSRRQLSMPDPAINRLVELIKAPRQIGIVQGLLGDDRGEAGAQDPVIRASAKQRGSTTLSCQPIAMGSGNAFDHAVQSKPTQVVAHLPHGHVVGRLAQERSPVGPQVAAGETMREQTEQQQRTEQGLHRRAGKA
jgi:hypothetical protein